jgi:acyl carrier protein
LTIEAKLLSLLDDVLNRSVGFGSDTHLIGAVPEMDSMGVVAVITALEERFGVVVDDDEIDGAVFATVGSLAAFVRGKLAEA